MNERAVSVTGALQVVLVDILTDDITVVLGLQEDVCRAQRVNDATLDGRNDLLDRIVPSAELGNARETRSPVSSALSRTCAMPTASAR